MATIKDNSTATTDTVRRRIRDAVAAAALRSKSTTAPRSLRKTPVVLKRRYLSKDRKATC